jgi:hypothetical protein
LRDSPALAYGAAGGVLLMLVAWGPTPAFRQIAWICVFAALLASGITILRRQTAAEFPGELPADAVRDLPQNRTPEPAQPPEHAAGDSRTLAEIDHLGQPHERGDLHDSGSSAGKTKS